MDERSIEPPVRHDDDGFEPATPDQERREKVGRGNLIKLAIEGERRNPSPIDGFYSEKPISPPPPTGLKAIFYRLRGRS